MRPLYDTNAETKEALPRQEKALKKKKKEKKDKIKNPLFDIPLFIIVMSLLVFGLVMLYSSSYAYAYYRWKDSTFYISKQLVFALMGVVAMLAASRVDYHIFKRLNMPIYFVTLGLLLFVLLFMPEYSGAKRWIFLPFGNFQPGEIAKFSVIVMLSVYISKNYKEMRSLKKGIVIPMLFLLPIVLLMVLEPHLSGTILILSIACIMLFVGGTALKWFAAGSLGLAALVGMGIIMFPQIVPYAQSRIYNWLHPLEDTTGASFQTIQGLYAVGSGGPLGLGLGNSRQKHMYVPEPYNDFIYSILCEELGFVGALIVILLFVALLLRAFYIAVKARDRFGSMLAIGISVQITLQAALNIAVVTNTIPNTGISLPFFSYGGTSLLMLLGEIGVLLSVSRQANIEKT